MKKFLFGVEARQKVFNGIETLYKAVSSTLGPYGETVALDKRAVVHNTKDGVTVVWDVQVEDQFEEMGVKTVKEASDRSNIQAGDGPQPLYSLILTPNGFVRMGDIKVGDKICGTNNSIQEVLGVFPKGEKEICEVKLADGRVVECCEDHLWSVTTKYGKEKVLTAKELMQDDKMCTVNSEGHRTHKYFIQNTTVEFNKQDLPIDPYFLGILIGDGSMSGTGNIELSLGPNKEHILDKIPCEFSCKFVEDKNYFRVVLPSDLKEPLKKLSLYGVKSSTKFIPKEYIYTSKEDRKALLRGLLDTDGHINDRGLFEFSTVSKDLAEDFMALCRSLGYPLNYRLHTRENDKDSYSNTPIYRIQQLQGYKYGFPIDSVQKTGKSTEMQCIKVSNDDNLYITDGYVVTHNTTSVIVLAYNFCKEWLKYGNQKLNTIKVKRGIEKAINVCVEEVKKLSKHIDTQDKFEMVGTISSQDSVIGKKVAEAFMMAGEMGAIDIERGEVPGIEIEHTDGLSFDSGFQSGYFCNDRQNNRAVMEDVHVLVTDKVIKKEMQILPIMDNLGKQGIKQLLIISENLEGEALGFVLNNLNMFHTCAVKNPTYGLSKIGIMDDICALTGATKLTEAGGVRIEKASLEHLGRVKKAVVERDRTVLVALDDIEAKKRISDRIDLLKGGLKDEPEDTPKHSELKHRLATLTDGITVLKVGSHSEIERHEEKARVEDAVRAVRSAAEEGVVPGGGTTYLRCIPAVDKLLAETTDEHEKIGVGLVRKILPSIALRVLEVAGIEDKEHIVAKVKESKDWEGYNFENGEIEDLWELGVLDAAKVIRCALQNSASVAKNFVSLGVAISPVREGLDTVKAVLGLDQKSR